MRVCICKNVNVYTCVCVRYTERVCARPIVDESDLGDPLAAMDQDIEKLKQTLAHAQVTRKIILSALRSQN